jgi:hypothetical protein
MYSLTTREYTKKDRNPSAGDLAKGGPTAMPCSLVGTLPPKKKGIADAV